MKGFPSGFLLVVLGSAPGVMVFWQEQPGGAASTHSITHPPALWQQAGFQPGDISFRCVWKFRKESSSADSPVS